MGRFHRVASSLSTHQYVCPPWHRASVRCRLPRVATPPASGNAGQTSRSLARRRGY